MERDNDSAGSDNAPRMTKREAIALLGGTQEAASVRVGVTQQAVNRWPQVLSDKIRDRVQAALWRDHCEQLRVTQQREQRRRARMQREQARQADKPTEVPATASA